MRGPQDGGLARPAPSRQVRARTSLESVPRRLPYAVLTLVLGTAAAFVLLVGVVLEDEADLRSNNTVLAVVLAGLALASWVALPRIPDELGLDIAIATVSLLAGWAAYAVPRMEAQFLVGICLTLFGVFAAYFRPRPRFLAHLVLLVSAYAAGVALNPQLESPWDLVLVCMVIVAVSLMVSGMAERLRRLALRDSLTGALNRRGLEVTSSALAATARRTGAPLAVVMIDLDGFKSYNDANGHLAGDQLMADLVEAWRSALRGSDLLGRYGGDEFALVLPGTDVGDAEELVARLHDAHPAAWTAGVAAWDGGCDLYTALSAADALLYDAKRRHR
ncbi:MAG: diguanylate cyclase [Frankiales bacterium]|nr:diguanylate cyclase [Frankiales bacterium]